VICKAFEACESLRRTDAFRSEIWKTPFTVPLQPIVVEFVLVVVVDVVVFEEVVEFVLVLVDMVAFEEIEVVVFVVVVELWFLVVVLVAFM
jgi:hypothetical protein